MDSNTPFNLTIFTDSTRKMCTCSATAIIIIVIFVITPLSNLFKTSILMKIIAILLLLYTFYLNTYQTNLLRTASQNLNSDKINSQLNINIICSYVFTLFIGLLIIFIIRSFF